MMSGTSRCAARPRRLLWRRREHTIYPALALTTCLLWAGCGGEGWRNHHGLQTENVFLITIDGLRWQEVFAGADSLCR